jgi:hypothetical protein
VKTDQKAPSVQKQSTSQRMPNLTEQHEAFLKHLQRVSGIVQTWPAWQQQVLGGALARSTGTDETMASRK